MPTYLYEDLVTGERYECEQRITDQAHQWRLPEGETDPAKGHPVRRLIASAPRFNLVSGDSGGWADQGYSKTEPQRQAEQQLGRKLHKPL
jgi:hypothetical protein